MIMQLDLRMGRPQGDRHNVAWLEEWLRGRGWVLARDILVANGMAATDAHRRWLRALAEQSAEIASGQAGYALVTEISVEEIRHTATWYISQAKKMIRRGIALQRLAARRCFRQKTDLTTESTVRGQ